MSLIANYVITPCSPEPEADCHFRRDHFIGAVRFGTDLTIQATDPAALRKIAEAFNAAADLIDLVGNQRERAAGGRTLGLA